MQMYNLKTKKELYEKFISAAKAITLGSVKSANVSFLKRISHVLSQNGGHFKHLL